MSYPIGEPHSVGVMPTPDGHGVYWEVYGNPDGKPAIVLHGGPGSGAARGGGSSSTLPDTGW